MKFFYKNGTFAERFMLRYYAKTSRDDYRKQSESGKEKSRELRHFQV
jgi:hypothetical protein